MSNSLSMCRWRHDLGLKQIKSAQATGTEWQQDGFTFAAQRTSHRRLFLPRPMGHTGLLQDKPPHSIPI